MTAAREDLCSMTITELLADLGVAVFGREEGDLEALAQLPAPVRPSRPC